MTTKLIWITPNAQEVIMYCARVSNPKNQNSGNTGLLNYCMKHGHWSVFEMASACFEIKTTRAISAQILRHRSFSFQEFSQRYAESTEITKSIARRQDTKNRQNSINDIPEDVQQWWHYTQKNVYETCLDTYQDALGRGIAKECARAVLPMNTGTTIYMSGTIRSWIHYLRLRTDPSTQLEHREIAENIKTQVQELLPEVKI